MTADAGSALRAGSFGPLAAAPAGSMMRLRLPDGRRAPMPAGDNALFTPKSLGIVLERHGWRIAARRWWRWRVMDVTARKL